MLYYVVNKPCHQLLVKQVAYQIRLQNDHTGRTSVNLELAPLANQMKNYILPQKYIIYKKKIFAFQHVQTIQLQNRHGQTLDTRLFSYT